MYAMFLLHRNLECQVHESWQIGSGQTGDGKSERRRSRNQQTKMDYAMLSHFSRVRLCATP